MNWIDDTQNAINFIECNLLEDIGVSDVSKHVNSSIDYFQRTFNIVTGLSISEYIRNRRLTLAGEEIKNTRAKVVDISLKYGYDSPESFTKAFTRFHGVAPAFARVSSDKLKYFYPLSIKVNIKGGFGMNRKIIPNIPDIDYYGNDVEYDFNVLEAIFKMIGKNVSRSELAVYSGMGNRFCWKAGAWEHGYETMNSIDEMPFETEIRLLKSIGWEAKYISILRDNDGKPLNTNNEQIRQDFIDSIDKGYPVISRNTYGHKRYIFIGYEDGGIKIISTESAETIAVHVANETVIRENWEDCITDYILLKEKAETVSEKERVLDILKLIVRRARMTDEINKLKVGFAAWESYLHDLESSDFSSLSLEEVGIDGGRMCIYCDGLCQIFARNETLPYYQSLAERYPEWRDELTAAVTALDECQKYAGFLWTQGFSIDEKGYEKFRDPAARKILADEGRKAMLMDMEAIEQFEKILTKENIGYV
jgi:AraC-like DNA-binding protein